MYVLGLIEYNIKNCLAQFTALVTGCLSEGAFVTIIFPEVIAENIFERGKISDEKLFGNNVAHRAARAKLILLSLHFIHPLKAKHLSASITLTYGS